MKKIILFLFIPLTLSAATINKQPKYTVFNLENTQDNSYRVNENFKDLYLNKLSIANGVDNYSNQTIAGNKTFNNTLIVENGVVKASGLAGTGAPTTSGGIFHAYDTGGYPGNGGGIIFGAASSGDNFAGIKGFITDGGSNSIGELRFYVRAVVSDADLTQVMSLQVGGNMQMEVSGGGYYDASTNQWTNGASYEKYKTNIDMLTFSDAIADLKNIKMRKYQYKVGMSTETTAAASPTIVYGYVADELPENFKQYIIAENGGLTMNGLFIYVTSVAQAQQKKIDDFEARIKALENKNK